MPVWFVCVFTDGGELCLRDCSERRHSSYPHGPCSELQPCYVLLSLWASGPILCSPVCGSASVVLLRRAEAGCLPETMALIWIIKGVRHYDTVSPCRGGQHTNIQAHTIFPLFITPFLVLALNKLQAWVGPWMSQAGSERSSLVNVTSAIGVSEKSLLGLTNTCSFFGMQHGMKAGSSTFSIVESVHNGTLT